MLNIMSKKELFYTGMILLCYFMNKFYLKNITDNFFIDGYLNDFLCGMLFAFVIVCACRSWIRVEISNSYILVITLIAGFFWEYITPFYHAESVTDNMDILCYYFGSLVYIKVKTYL